MFSIAGVNFRDWCIFRKFVLPLKMGWDEQWTIFIEIDPSSQVCTHPTILAAPCHTFCLFQTRLKFFRENGKRMPSGTFLCPVALWLLSWEQWEDGEAEANPRREMEKSKKASGEQRHTEHCNQKPKREGRRSACASLPPAKIPTGIWKSKVSLLWPQQIYCKELQLIFNRAPPKAFSII